MDPPWLASLPGWTWLLVLLPFLAVVLYRWGPVPRAGPVLSCEVLRLTRRSPRSLFGARTVYVVLLFGVLLISWASATGEVSSNHLRQLLREGVAVKRNRLPGLLARLEETFFIVQMAAIVLLTPVFTAGSVAEEKQRKTLDFLLLTRLSPTEIVVGKLLGRVAHLASIVLAGLPVLAALQLLGGMDIRPMLLAFAGCGMTLLSVAAVSLLQSVRATDPTQAVFRAYLAIGVYLFVSFCLYPFHFVRGPSTGGFGILDAVTIGNPIVADWRAEYLLRGGAAGRDIFQEVVLAYCLWHGLVMLGCLVLASRLLGRVRSGIVAGAASSHYGKRYSASDELLLSPAPPVWDCPLLWKAIYFEGAGKKGGWRIIAWYASLLSIFCIGGSFLAATHGDVAGNVNFWARAVTFFLTGILFLAITVRAAGTLTRERERRTLDSLLTTPVSLDDLVGSKVLGSIAHFRLWWIVLGATWLLGACFGGIHPLAFPLALVALAIHTLFAAVLGLFCSQMCRSTAKATACAVTLQLTLTLGHWVPYLVDDTWKPPAVSVRGEAELFHLYGLTPSASLAGLLYSWEEASQRGHLGLPASDISELAAGGLTWYAWLGCIFYLWTYLRLGLESNRLWPPARKSPPRLRRAPFP